MVLPLNFDRLGSRPPTGVDGHGTVLGIFDFSYQHYALGDLLTLQVDLASMAIDMQIEEVDVVAFADPDLPSARMQGFVTPDNYLTYFDNVAAIFGCNPMLRSLHLLHDAAAFGSLVLSRHEQGAPMWPPFDRQLKMQQTYPVGHERVNSFHARHGYLPRLSAPRGYRRWARRFHEGALGCRPLVVINPRQSSLTQHPAALYRDARLESWYSFIDVVAARQPDILFVMVGGYQEWEHRLQLRRNVFIPRAVGLSLPHELALMKIARLFMGSSSGFPTFATFTDIPYAIVNFERRFAPHGGMTAGDRRYPFARVDQIITWERETTEQLVALFEELLVVGRNGGRAESGNDAAVGAGRAEGR